MTLWITSLRDNTLSLYGIHYITSLIVNLDFKWAVHCTKPLPLLFRWRAIFACYVIGTVWYYPSMPSSFYSTHVCKIATLLHAVVGCQSSLLCRISLYEYTSLFTHSTVSGHLSSFQFWVILKVIMNILIHAFQRWYTFLLGIYYLGVTLMGYKVYL